MSYIVVCCPHCGKFWIVRRSTERTKCPWCSKSSAVKNLRIYAKEEDISSARRRLVEITSRRGNIETPREHSVIKAAPTSRKDRLALAMMRLTDEIGSFDIPTLAARCEEEGIPMGKEELEEAVRALMDEGEVMEKGEGRYAWVD